MRKINTRRFVRATRSTPREINRQIILNLVREHQPISRADLARRMDIGRGMVTSLVDELLEEEAIYEGATVDAPRGRKPKMLYVRTRDRLVVAVDVRFSRTYLMLSDFGGTPIALEQFDTLTDPAALVAELAERIQRVLATHGAVGRCEGVGLVVPGMVDHRSGRVLYAPQLGWRDVALRDLLSAALDFPVHVENAPIACALAHMWLGQRGSEAVTDFVYVTVGDGVGAGVVVNGEVVRGHGNTAGEFGHIPIDLAGPRCLCGAVGCLEAHTSNLATLSRYLGQELSPSQTRRLLQETGLTILDVMARARSGDARAVAALEETARHLGTGLAVIINALNPGQIYVGGEITAAWEQLAPIVRRGIAERALTSEASATPLIPEPPSDHPRLRGATALVAAPLFAAPQVA
ncbi:ROK family transcriptional regulator [Roseisolibacter agri]|uniref:Xylose repressor protein n=1 Tax=Roseisolibacter agri TaxID=2014610 RepID=A0AA37QBQ7_9BACT|nr:ROK family transcriptional regulator [Roseisolibacter agri]GLC23748.1 xylose repressor protein [Roseisolibacter agri]